MIGNVGSGKTASMVREMYLNPSMRKTYSNIMTKNIPNNILLNYGMIIKNTEVVSKTGNIKVDYSLNTEFWKSIKEPINVIIDEAHTVINSRRSFSHINVIMMDWVTLIRKVLGSNGSGYGEAVFITQLPTKLDINVRDLATSVRYHKMHYDKLCKRCKATWAETSDTSEPVWSCPICSSKDIKVINHIVEVWHFSSMKKYDQWRDEGKKSYHKHYMINDISKYFNMYDTFQWDNLIFQK